jgi:hypothetical protein
VPDYVLSVALAERANPRRPDPKFGAAIVDLAKERWGSTANVLKQMGHKPDNKNNTLRLLAVGKGSDQAARSLLHALERAGIDTSKLPPMYPDEIGDEQAATWRDQWLLIGDLLHEHAPKIFETKREELLPLARAIAKQVGAELDIGRAT